MKKIGLLLLLTIFYYTANAQEKTNKKVIKEVEEVNQTTKEVNETVENTNNAVKSTIKNSRETIKTIGEFFGKGKKEKKKNKSKSDLTIIIHQTTYDNDNLNMIYTKLSKVEGTKNPSKSFSEGVATIHLDSKENADAIWQKIPKELRDLFTLLEINEHTILLENKLK